MAESNITEMVQCELEKDGNVNIKKEQEAAPAVMVKPEPLECLVCGNMSPQTYDMFGTRTLSSGTTLHHFLKRMTQVDLTLVTNFSKQVCQTCLDLINVLEQAELDYMKLKDTFDMIVSKNPLFELHSQVPGQVKSEQNEVAMKFRSNKEPDSEDEPLALKKKKRKVVKKKKNSSTTAHNRKQRSNSNNHRWHNAGGGDTMTEIATIKEEKSADGYESEIAIEFNFEDDGSSFVPEDASSQDSKEYRKQGPGRPRKAKCILALPLRKKRETKVKHECNSCDAKFTSLSRLERHQQAAHGAAQAPYICEVCGAAYKHKRACDIHVAMHRGISDWKCEECNKLFPSKGALRRHNNIHTGKLNYQCDQCGKSFIHLSSFKMHKLSHSGVKPHTCATCGLQLMTRSHLQRHARVHSGEKRHECHVCGKRFSERYNLAAHSKSHEEAGGGGGAAGGAGGEAVPRRRTFRCHFCAERFERRYMLERHTAVSHGCALERPAPTPRNTMAKLLKAQAQRPGASVASGASGASGQSGPSGPSGASTEADSKEPQVGEPEKPLVIAPKLFAQLSAETNAWGVEFLRHEYSSH